MIYTRGAKMCIDLYYTDEERSIFSAQGMQAVLPWISLVRVSMTLSPQNVKGTDFLILAGSGSSIWTSFNDTISSSGAARSQVVNCALLSLIPSGTERSLKTTRTPL